MSMLPISDLRPRQYTTAFKERAVLRLEAGAQASALAAELGVRRKLLYDWHKAWRAQGVAGLSRVANPYDNFILSCAEGAKAESIMKTLKTEEVNGKVYATIDHARRDIGAFIDTVYNSQRLHSALGYKPPVEFEVELRHSANP